ncbi:MAG: hypothetical protein ACP5SH_26815 [Syntrophobacteraceae bacterium]
MTKDELYAGCEKRVLYTGTIQPFAGKVLTTVPADGIKNYGGVQLIRCRLIITDPHVQYLDELLPIAELQLAP